jgi:spore coat protein A, manganese oxidase
MGARQKDVNVELGRRAFLRWTGAAVGGTLALGAAFSNRGIRDTGPLTPSRRRHRHRTPKPEFSAGPTLAKFVDPLRMPRVISPSGLRDGVPFYDVNMVQFRRKLHRDLPPTTLWGYNAQYPGPTFEARRGHPIAVRWHNSLPPHHLLPVDTTIHGAQASLPEVRTVVHLHGNKVLPDSDGYPEAWFTNRFVQTGPYFENQIYRYPNDQLATTLWYHDHALGITRLNIYAGLSGMYLLRDRVEDDLNLPRGPYEIPLMIQDRFFNADGSLLYPTQAPGDPDPRVPPIWIPEFFGDTVLVNGRIWPFLEVEPRKYRFRILDSSNARFYRLTLNETNARGEPTGQPGPPFFQIGSDGGFLPAPVRLNELTIAPAERLDVIVDFSGADGKVFVLNNDAKAPFPDGDDVVPTDIMMFKVTRRLRGRDTSSLPSSLAPVPLLEPSSAVKTRDLVLSEQDSDAGSPIIALINTHWDEPVTEDPQAGSVEIWRLVNTTEDAHPIHVHLVQFQVLDRQPFDVAQFPGRLVFTGPAVQPPPNERPAFKDTVQAFPGEVTRIIARFDLPSGTPVGPGDRFRYVFHCHIVEHEENEMMRPYDVVG